jgi:carbonic anhydrase
MAEWIIAAVADDDLVLLEEVRALFSEYHEWLGEAVCASRLVQEIANLPGPYSAPQGKLFLAHDGDGAAIGCIGLRPHSGSACEVKRLYVRQPARGGGVGRALLARAIQAAREIGYAEALVTTLPDSMPLAASMYERAGFERVEPFLDFSVVAEDVPVLYLSRTLR